MTKRPDGTIDSPAGMLGHLTPRMLPMAQVVEKELQRRREYEQRADVVERRQRAEREAELAREQQGKRVKEPYGPPDPRKGRLPMTR